MFQAWNYSIIQLFETQIIKFLLDLGDGGIYGLGMAEIENAELTGEVVGGEEIGNGKPDRLSKPSQLRLGKMGQTGKIGGAGRRWIVPWADSEVKPAIYHCISRVVDRRLAFGARDKEQFRIYMRMVENFSGCRVLSYCLMCNHIHLLLEVPPMPKGGFSDEELLGRLRALYGEEQVALVATELADARKVVAEGRAPQGEAFVLKIHERYTYRMHDLSEFMKTLLQRFTRWHNRVHERRGNLWEETFKSVVVESGTAARTIAAYIDLNPVRAGMVELPENYRWSSYGEAIGGGGMGNGKKARAGLVRAWGAHRGMVADASLWAGAVSIRYRNLLIGSAEEKTSERIGKNGTAVKKILRKGASKETIAAELAASGSGGGSGRGENAGDGGAERDMSLGRMLRCRVRYFTEGAVIGSRMFVDDVFRQCRDRFGPNRKNGARKMRGKAGDAARGILWSARDLKDLEL